MSETQNRTVEPDKIAMSESFKQDALENAKAVVTAKTKDKLAEFKNTLIAPKIAKDFVDFLAFDLKGLEIRMSDLKDGKLNETARAVLFAKINEMVDSKGNVGELVKLFGATKVENAEFADAIPVIISATIENEIEKNFAKLPKGGEKLSVSIGAGLTMKVDVLDTDGKVVDKTKTPETKAGKPGQKPGQILANGPKTKIEGQKVDQKLDQMESEAVLKKLKKSGLVGMVLAMVLSSKDETNKTLMERAYAGESPIMAGILGSLGIGKFKQDYEDLKSNVADNAKIGGLFASWQKIADKVKAKMSPKGKTPEQAAKNLLKVKPADFLKQLSTGNLAKGVAKAFMFEGALEMKASEKPVKVVLPKGEKVMFPKGGVYAVADSLTDNFASVEAKTDTPWSGVGKEGEKTFYFKKMPAGTKFPQGAKIEQVA